MNLRALAATGLTVGILTLGTGGAALAAEPAAATGSTTTSSDGCAAAKEAATKVQDRIGAAIQALQKQEDQATSHGHALHAAVLKSVIDRLKGQQEKVTAQVEAALAKACPAEGAGSTGGAGSAEGGGNTGDAGGTGTSAPEAPTTG